MACRSRAAAQGEWRLSSTVGGRWNDGGDVYPRHHYPDVAFWRSGDGRFSWEKRRTVHSSSEGKPPQESEAPRPTRDEDRDGDETGRIQDENIGDVSGSRPPPETPAHDISYIPSSLRPYARLARLDRPIGTMLLLHPCLWSTALAAPLGAFPDPSTCALFAAGSFAMRGAGCTINDMWDAGYDREVARTRDRPLASGELGYPQAWAFLGLQLTCGLGVLVSLPHLGECLRWGVASLPLVAAYPLMKRYTDYPQAVLGLTFNWGAIMGHVAVNGAVDWSVVGPLYGSGVAWTLVYDTLYAHQDKEDDRRLGLRSTAITFGDENTKPVCAALTGLTWGGWCLAGYNAGIVEPVYYGGVSLAGLHVLWQVATAKLDDAENLARRFRSNNLVGWMVFGSCVAGNVLSG